MKLTLISLIPAVTLLVSACSNGPAGPVYGYGNPGYNGGSTVFVNGGYDHGNYADNNYNGGSTVNVNRTTYNQSSRSTVNRANASTRSKTTIAQAGKSRAVSKPARKSTDSQSTDQRQ